MNIGVVAQFRVKKEFLEEVYEQLVILHTATHANDEGCIKYDLHQDIEDEQTFIFVETWESADALSLHEQKEHFNTCIGNIQDKLESIDVRKTTQKI